MLQSILQKRSCPIALSILLPKSDGRAAFHNQIGDPMRRLVLIDTAFELLRMLWMTLALSEKLSLTDRVVAHLKSSYLLHNSNERCCVFECVFTNNIMVTCRHSGGVPN